MTALLTDDEVSALHKTGWDESRSGGSSMREYFSGLGWPAVFLLFFGASNNANALSPAQVSYQLDSLIAAEILNPAAELKRSLSRAEKDNLLQMLNGDSRVASARNLDKHLVVQVVHDYTFRHRVSLDQARSLGSYYTDKIGATPSPVPVTELLQLVMPYMRDAGLCHGDPLSEVGATCAFVFVPGGSDNRKVSVTGNFDAPGTKGKIDLSPVQPGTDLYKVMAGCASSDNPCRDAASPLVGASIGATKGMRVSRLDRVKPLRNTSSSVDVLLSLIGIAPAMAELAYNGDYSGGDSDETELRSGSLTVARFAYMYGYYFRYRCGFLSSGAGCEGWGEFYAAGNLKYGVSGSDNVMAVLPLALICTNTCFFSGVTQFAASYISAEWLGGTPSFDPLAYLLYAADIQYWQLRGAGSYIQHTALGGCGVIPMPYETRLSYQLLDQYWDQMPYSQYVGGFHTSYQIPATNPLVPALSTNMDPQPTMVSAMLPEISCAQILPITVNFTWTYNFLMEIAWNTNVIFSGLDNLNTTNYCGPDEIWAWHGAAYGGKHGLPGIDWTASFAGGHLPYLPAP